MCLLLNHMLPRFHPQNAFSGVLAMSAHPSTHLWQLRQFLISNIVLSESSLRLQGHVECVPDISHNDGGLWMPPTGLLTKLPDRMPACRKHLSLASCCLVFLLRHSFPRLLDCYGPFPWASVSFIHKRMHLSCLKFCCSP